jgi:hypothetical protein
MNDIQHTQMLLGAAMVMAALGTLLLALLGRWIGAWITLLAILAALLICYQPLINASLFAGFKTDLLRRILIGLIPFTLGLLVVSRPNKIAAGRILFALLAPSLLLWWVFAHFDLAVPRQTLLLHKIVPIGLAIFIAWLLIEPLAVKSPGAAAPIVIGAFSGGLAFLLMLSAENQAGLIAPIIPATALGALLAAIAASILKSPITFARGPVLLWLTSIAALFAFLWLDTDQLPTRDLYWTATAPLLAWIPQWKPIHRRNAWQRESLRLLLVLVPVVIAIILAFNQHKKEAAESGDEYGQVQSPAPMCPSQIPMPNTTMPPTIT